MAVGTEKMGQKEEDRDHVKTPMTIRSEEEEDGGQK